MRPILARGGRLINLPSETRDLSGCVSLMNGALGCSPLNCGNNRWKGLSDLFYLILCYGGSYLFDSGSYSGLRCLVSDSFYIVLARPLEG
jgi:hypothetical protein